MRPPNPFAKLFHWLCACAIVFFIVVILRPSNQIEPPLLNLEQTLWELKSTADKKTSNVKDEKNLAHENLKYILQWTAGSHSPFHFMGKGRSAFVKNECEFNNCYVTDDRGFFIDPKDFDAVAFNGREVAGLVPKDLPKVRGSHQKYIFANMESSHYYPVCKAYFDNFFNWTWTYRLDSDVRWGYVTVYNLSVEKVGPATDVKWVDNLGPVSEELKKILSIKTKAVAWFVSNCRSRSKREDFVRNLKNELAHYDLTVDIYGNCGNLKCPRTKSKECNKWLARDYFFYLSFENSFAKDYVTEKLFTALDNFAVPVVYGAANYSRFLPPGSYLNSRELGVQELARTIHEIIQDKTRERYYDFFRWRNHYYYEATADNVDVCNLCALMNDEVKFRSFSVYKDFRAWWNPPDIPNLCK